VQGLDRRELRRLVAAATAAPSLHNSQPWRFVLHPDRIELHADPGRLLRVADPMGRELHISCGAALFNLEVAMRAQGRHARPRLLPSPDDRRHLATLPVGPPARISRHDTALHAAIRRRHTQRGPFHERTPPQAVLDQLTVAAREEGADLVFVDEPDRTALLGVVRSAEAQQEADPGYRLELHAWTTHGDRDEGVPTSAYAPVDPTRRLPVRDFEAGGVQPPEQTFAQYEESAPIAVLTTPEDSPLQWLRAGQALQRVLLTATVEGLVASMFTQPLELPPVRDLLIDAPRMRWPQMILRIGYGPAAEPTPRRPLDDVIDEFGGRGVTFPS